jgi:hypothetical protein
MKFIYVAGNYFLKTHNKGEALKEASPLEFEIKLQVGEKGYYFTRDASGCFTLTLDAKRAAMAMKETAPIPMNINVMILFSFPPTPLRQNL